MHPDYVWPDFAQIWQTPGDGEKFFEEQNAQTVEERGGIFEAFGVGYDDSIAMASWSDETMASCILDLYRSASPNPYTDWKDAWGPTKAPGFVIHPTADPFGEATQSREVADARCAPCHPRCRPLVAPGDPQRRG